MRFRISSRLYKKYDVYLPDLDKWLPFGDNRYEHYQTSDAIPASLHIYKEHHDPVRRARYRARASKIRDADGDFTYLDRHSPNYWAYNYLW